MPPLRAVGWRRVLDRMRSATQRHHASVLAGGVAFFAFLSILPALAALVSIYGLLANPADVARQVEGIAGALPPDVKSAIVNQMAQLTARSPRTLTFEAVVSIVATIWAATKGMKALITGLSLAFGQDETRGFIRLNATAFLFTLGSIVAGVIAIGAIIVLPAVLSFLNLSGPGEALLWWLRWPMLTVMVLLSLTVAYRFGPAQAPPRRRWVTPGALAATALWLAGSAIFSWFVSRATRGDRVDGSLGVVITILTWFLLSAYVVILGAELDAEIANAAQAEAGPRRDGDDG
ncbi:MAG TPA: YihY/virulence factor BrkB family protein [Polyangia bacterium]|nr:YihY/virulence factor BrkB family protein [Polyangia bacterium]